MRLSNIDNQVLYVRADAAWIRRLLGLGSLSRLFKRSPLVRTGLVMLLVVPVVFLFGLNVPLMHILTSEWDMLIISKLPAYEMWLGYALVAALFNLYFMVRGVYRTYLNSKIFFDYGMYHHMPAWKKAAAKV